MNTPAEVWANIAVVERETGLGKDTLRIWERRYGFPKPERDGNGDRLYSAEQIARLRLIKRLMDRGHRPGRLVTAEVAALQALAAESPNAAPGGAVAEGRAAAAGQPPVRDGVLAEVFDHLRRHDAVGLRRALSHQLAKSGLQNFVLDIAPQLNQMIGEGWESGQIEVFEEHLYTEQMQLILRQAIAGLPPGTRRPVVLLTTVPEEHHVLGILMLEALLTLQGIHCIALGTQTPLSEIVAAVDAHRADAVALSFSGAFPARQVAPLVDQLRTALPVRTELWLGGAGLARGLEKQLEKRGASAADSALPAEKRIRIGRSLGAALDFVALLNTAAKAP